MIPSEVLFNRLVLPAAASIGLTIVKELVKDFEIEMAKKAAKETFSTFRRKFHSVHVISAEQKNATIDTPARQAKFSPRSVPQMLEVYG